VGVGGKNYVLAALPMGKGPSNCGTGGWMGPRASLEVCGGANFLPTSGLKPQNAQLTAVHYTGYAVPIPLELISVKNWNVVWSGSVPLRVMLSEFLPCILC